MASEEQRAVEAIVMVSDRPVEVSLLAQLLEISPTRVEEICDELARSYESEERGFQLARVAGGYRFQSHPDEAPYVERFVLEGQSARLSAAALETLAIVAYKQPVSRAQVAAIRGVNADGVIRTLQARGFIHEVGRDPGPGQASLYGTTPMLLEKLGLDRVEQLPPLAQFVPGPEIMDALERSLRADRATGEATDEPAEADDLPPDQTNTEGWADQTNTDDLPPDQTNTEGWPDHTDTEGWADHTDTEGWADHTDTEGRADHTDTEGRADHTDTEGRADQTNTEGWADHTDTEGWADHTNTEG